MPKGLRNTVESHAGDPNPAELNPIAEPMGFGREEEKDPIALFPVADGSYTQRRFRIEVDAPPTAATAPAP